MKVFMPKVRIRLSVLPEQRDLIDRAATTLGKSRSDFMREVACERAQVVLLDQILFGLNNDRFLEFNAMLDAPALSNPRLERLMKVKTLSAMQ